MRADEDALTHAIVAIAARYGRFGYRRITKLVNDAGWPVGTDRVQRIWRREGLKVPKKHKPRGRLWLNDGSCIRLRPERPNHVWSYDFVEAQTHDGRKLRLMALIHTIGRADGPGAANPWIDKYIFPGGYTPALSEIVPVIERAGLHITDIEVLRLHYAETLKAWRQRFMANRAEIATIYDERFCRMWEFYLAASEAAFRHGGLVVFQIQLSKRIETVPLTRNYIPDWERHRGEGAGRHAKAYPCEPETTTS